MIENEADDYLPEMEDMLKGRNFTIALEKYNQWAGSEIKKDPTLLRQIYEGILEDARPLIEHKLSHLPHYVKNNNYRRLGIERNVLARNIEFLNTVFTKIDPNDNELKDIVMQFKKFNRDIRKQLQEFEQENEKLLKAEEARFKEDEQKRVLKAQEAKLKEDEGIEEDYSKKTVQLLIEPLEGDYHDKNVEYLPFLGVTTIRLRVIVNKPVKNLWIKPRFTPDLYAENPEWSHYICGMDNEHGRFDLRRGFMATYGGGEMAGFKIGPVDKHREQYVFFFLRHQNEQMQNQTPKGEEPKRGKIQKIIDYSITFEAIDEQDWNQEVLDEITIQLKYPRDIVPELGKLLPDYADPKCPVIANYDYDFEEKKRYREITFKGNQLPGYYPRWIPPRKIHYNPVPDKLKEKLKNIIIRSYPNGEVKIFYKFEMGIFKDKKTRTNLRLIGHLKGTITDSVFLDPLKMVTAELFRFYSDEFVAIRVWFWWIDLRLNDLASGIKTGGILHEMPDFERVDFIINLKKPTISSKMVEFIATDVHWKEFWLDVKDVKKSIDVRFTNIGLNLINWKQLSAFFSHHVGPLYNPLPAILYSIYNSFDEKAFYCVICGERTKLPESIKTIRRLRKRLERFNARDMTEESYRKKTEKILADQVTDLMCPNCNSFITKDGKLQYMFLFSDFSKLHKHLTKEVLGPALRKETKAEGPSVSAKIRNCHVPTPIYGKTSNEWCSSTVTKPLPLAQIESDQEYEERIHDKKLEYYHITNIEGLDNRFAAPLLEIGIIKIKDLMNASPDILLNKVNLDDLRDDEKNVYKKQILRWREMATLYQLNGIRSQYSDLLVEINYNLQKLHDFKGSPQELWFEMKQYNEKTNDVSRLPPLKEVENWINQAKTFKL